MLIAGELSYPVPDREQQLIARAGRQIEESHNVVGISDRVDDADLRDFVDAVGTGFCRGVGRMQEPGVAQQIRRSDLLEAGAQDFEEIQDGAIDVRCILDFPANAQVSLHVFRSGARSEYTRNAQTGVDADADGASIAPSARLLPSCRFILR